MHLSDLRRRLLWPRGAPDGEGSAARPPAMTGAAGLSPAGAWPRERLLLVEQLWGYGFIRPGGAEEVMRLAAPLGLSGATSVLLLGVGSGGPALRLSGEHGVWVCGCESDRDLAALAARRVLRSGRALAKRATIQAWDPLRPEFLPESFHHAIVVESLAGAAQADLLAALASALRPGGQLALQETVAAGPLDPGDACVAAWLRLEHRGLPLPDAAGVEGALRQLGFDLRAAEDVSAPHMRLAVQGWRRLVRMLDAERPDAQRAELLVREAELWLRRIRLMRAGHIRVMRWRAVARTSARARAACAAEA
jgi:SAM-dependent methyltransferase